MTPEQKARVSIDALLVQAGWHVCNVTDASIHAATGVAIREFPLNNGFGFADYLLYVNGKACGVIEAKIQAVTLTEVELHSSRYAQGLPKSLPAWSRPLPFVWESTGIETHFTNGLDPEPRARAVFAFFRPELLVQWLTYLPVQAGSNTAQETPGTFLTRMRSMPQMVTEWGSGGAHYALWPAQISAITNLEKSLAANKPKALIQMANLQRVKANLKRYKATVLQSAIDGVLVQSTSSFTAVPLQELIGRIAQGWNPRCDLNREPLPDEWAIIATTAVQPMQYLDNRGKPLPENLTPRPGIEIKNGDFLMTRKGPRKRAGVACLVRSTRHRLMVCDTVYRFRCDESKVHPEYLEIALNAPKVVDAIDRHKAGISESGVSLTHDKLGSVLIPLPSREAQAAIVAEVDRHLSIIREVEAEVEVNLQRAQALRQATLSKAFSGDRR